MLTIVNRTFILFILVFIKNTSEAQLSNKTFEKSIHVPASEVRMDSLLRIFSKQTGVEFSFNSRKISPSRMVPVARHTQSLSQWLSMLSNSLGIEHKVVGNHIILIDNEKGVSGKISAGTLSSGKAQSARNNPTPPATKSGDTQVSNIQDADDNLMNEQTQLGKVDSIRMRDERIEENSSVPVIVKEDSKTTEKIQTAPPISNMNTDNGNNNTRPRMRAIQIIGGYSEHGSGDMKGMSFGGEYTQYFNRKLSLSYNFRATINNGKDEMLVDNGGGSVTDASIRFTTAGLQIGVNGGFSLVNSAMHEFRISLGGLVRYQSASNGADGYSTWPPSSTGIPTMLVGYNNHTPQQTIAFGGILLLQYNFTFKSNLFLGAQTGFQTDTNGDAMLHVGALVVGKRI